MTKLILMQTHNGTFAFAPTHQANPSAKSKEPFFSQHFIRLYLGKIVIL